MRDKSRKKGKGGLKGRMYKRAKDERKVTLKRWKEEKRQVRVR